MALYKNDVIFELSRHQKEIDELKEFFHNKFPVKIIYPPGRVVKSRLPHNTKPDKPNSISFDLKATVKTETGTEIWRYAENIITDDKGRKKYLPKKFLFDGTKFLKREDIELIFFLLRKSEFCLGGDNQGPMPKFMFEDLVSEAEKKAAKKKIDAKVAKLLYDEDSCLPEDKLRAIAKAYHIPEVDTMTLPEVKIKIENKIYSKPTGPAEFFTMIDDDVTIKARKTITEAIDKKILSYDNGKKRWMWQLTRENGKVDICSVPATKTPNDAIYDVYVGDKQFREDLHASLLTGNPDAGKSKGKGKSPEKDDGSEE